MGILVIGRSGQLARSLCENHNAGGTSVAAVGRPEIDLLAAKDLHRAIDRYAPRLIVNTAAYTAVDRAETEADAAFRLNAEGPEILAKTCADRAIPLIHVSTDYVFDGSKDGAYSEDDPTGPTSVYGASKLEGERRVVTRCQQYIIFRTSWLYSPFGGNFVRNMLRLAKDRDAIDMVDDQFGSPTFAPHLADAILAVARDLFSQDRISGEGPWGIYHAAGQESTTWCRFAREVLAQSAKLGGPTARVNAIATADYPTAAKRPTNSRLDCAKLERIFGLRLPDWRIGVAECVQRLLVETSRPATADAWERR